MAKASSFFILLIEQHNVNLKTSQLTVHMGTMVRRVPIKIVYIPISHTYFFFLMPGGGAKKRGHISMMRNWRSLHENKNKNAKEECKKIERKKTITKTKPKQLTEERKTSKIGLSS